MIIWKPHSSLWKVLRKCDHNFFSSYMSFSMVDERTLEIDCRKTNVLGTIFIDYEVYIDNEKVNHFMSRDNPFTVPYVVMVLMYQRKVNMYDDDPLLREPHFDPGVDISGAIFFAHGLDWLGYAESIEYILKGRISLPTEEESDQRSSAGLQRIVR